MDKSNKRDVYRLFPDFLPVKIAFILRYELWKEKINQASTMFLMGHVYLDLDAIGSCIGLASLFQQLGKTSYIIINDTENELAVAQVLEKIKNVKI